MDKFAAVGPHRPGRDRGDPSRRQMSLMQVFRNAAQMRNGREALSYTEAGAESDMTRRSQQRREGGSETALRADLAMDVASLMNTIQLEAVIDLSDHPWLQRSVINFGFQDLSSLSRSQRMISHIATSIRETLITHEPRLNPATIDVRMPAEQREDDYRLEFEIAAEMVASPMDIPLDFVAEVDLGAGKIHMQKIGVGE